MTEKTVTLTLTEVEAAHVLGAVSAYRDTKYEAVAAMARRGKSASYETFAVLRDFTELVEKIDNERKEGPVFTDCQADEYPYAAVLDGDHAEICDSHASDIIRSLADAKGFVVKMIRPEDIFAHAMEEVNGIATGCIEELMTETLRRLNRLEDLTEDETEEIRTTVQNVAADLKLPTE